MTLGISDICELLIKFGYLIKTPMEADGTHLYGMASYLVTRAKPGTLGRLVVDYSPINSPELYLSRNQESNEKLFRINKLPQEAVVSEP